MKHSVCYIIDERVHFLRLLRRQLVFNEAVDFFFCTGVFFIDYLCLEQHSAVGAVIETAVVIGIFAVILALGLSACSREVYLVYLDLHGGTLFAVLLKGGTSQVADYGDHLALREHIVDELCIVIPCGAVEEVCLGLVSTLLLGAVNCDAELAEGCLACVAEFVGSKSACFDYDVGHSDYLSFLGFGFLFVCCDYIILCNIPNVKYNFQKFLNFGNAQHKCYFPRCTFTKIPIILDISLSI